MSQFNIDEPLISNVRPASDALVTIRIIKSFTYRNVKNHVIPSINLKTTTPSELLAIIRNTISTTGSFRPYRNIVYDTLKVYTHAHGSKSMNLVINFDNDEKDIVHCEDEKNLVQTEKCLWDLGIENETEISVFNYQDYVTFKANPEEKW